VSVGEGQQESFAATAYNTGLNATQFLQKTLVGKAIDNRDLFESLRLVAGGFRIYETTERENRGGVIRAAYSQRGFQVKNSIKKNIDDMSVTKQGAKVFIA
jgi:hypothetical protein